MTAAALYLPAPPPYEGPARCVGCAGVRVTGAQYNFNPDTRAEPLVVDELCAECGGCGRAFHDACDPRDHADWNPADVDDEDIYARDLDDDTTCLSCHGRRWWACQGFSEDYVAYLRIPCGCATDLLTQVEIGGSR